MDAQVKSPAVLADMVVDDLTWRCATRLRRSDWKTAIDELVSTASFALEKPTLDPAERELHGEVSILPNAILVTLVNRLGTRVGTLRLERPTIAPVLREYVRILRSIETCCVAETSPHFEALDIARRLVHDDAAEMLEGSFSGVHPDRETARRLFSLLVLLTHDTTKFLS
ncbi:MAG TPA: UPF0262 family protein [Pseudomonadota bacterium]|jgi:uncharacterized protein (UPF0262 family)|nr:UPF0262 family protein [Pseudomonadota bacterium]